MAAERGSRQTSWQSSGRRARRSEIFYFYFRWTLDKNKQKAQSTHMDRTPKRITLTARDLIGVIGIALAMIATLPLSVALLTNNCGIALASLTVIFIGGWAGTLESR
jgi:hypothetical protein